MGSALREHSKNARAALRRAALERARLEEFTRPASWRHNGACNPRRRGLGTRVVWVGGDTHGMFSERPSHQQGRAPAQQPALSGMLEHPCTVFLHVQCPHKALIHRGRSLRSADAGRPQRAPNSPSPPKTARRAGALWAGAAPRRVRFVRFAYTAQPGYVTANVGPVTLCNSPGVRCGFECLGVPGLLLPRAKARSCRMWCT